MLINVEVIYQWKSVVCLKYKEVGHRVDDCRILKKQAH
ncbi:DNA primase large subunit [Bienertia sinuspersici]